MLCKWKDKAHKLCIGGCENGCRRQKAKPVNLFKGIKSKVVKWPEIKK